MLIGLPHVSELTMSSNPDLTYGHHLKLDQLLSAQVPVSDSHDEMLFIIQHQTSELWMRLMVAELGAARQRLQVRDFRGARKALGRVSVVFAQLVQSWDVLRTLTPLDFAAFRGDLGPASGFQSYQYRMIEFMLGNRNAALLAPHVGNPEIHAGLLEELSQPSLYHVALEILQEQVAGDFESKSLDRTRPHVRIQAVEDAWAQVYGAPEVHPDLFDLAEQLVEIEDQFRCWRFNHVTTVERVIGAKQGTGGTSGVGYLRRMLDTVLFPELWSLRSGL